MKKWPAVIGIASTLFSGCASIMNGTYAGYPVETTPPGANVFVDGHSIGRTPLVIDRDNTRFERIRIEREGCPIYEVQVDPELSPWVLGNVIFGGVGLLIDISSPRAYERHPDHLTVAYGEQNGQCVILGSNLMMAQPIIQPRA